jgi:hypothetical protein
MGGFADAKGRFESRCVALANKSFRIDDDMVDYRYQLSVAPDTRKGYSATMGFLES